MRIKEYTVNWQAKTHRWTCTCPDFRFRRSQRGEECKHIQQVKAEQIAAQFTPTIDPRYKQRCEFEGVAQLLLELGEEFKRFEIAGSYRRQKPLLKDLDVVILLQLGELQKLYDLVQQVGYIENGKDQRVTAKIRASSTLEVQVDFRICYADSSWYTMLQHFTGSKEENVRLRRCAIAKGMKLNEYDLLDADGRPLPIFSERDTYSYLGEQYKEPWER